MKSASVVVPWVTDAERDAFLSQWNANPFALPDWLIMQRDEDCSGCGVTKNRGIQRALVRGSEVVVVLDGDCYPDAGADSAQTLEELVALHVAALEPQPVDLFESVTSPPSRGTPYSAAARSVLMPVAASMGFWTEVGDYCAVRQLSYGAAPMEFSRKTIHGRYFPLCGMNLAFRPADWAPWWNFIDVSRFDDIWMGWLWQREAYRRGACFNLAGPLVRHSRQSNVWRNLRDEALHLEANDRLWASIARHPEGDYASLARLLPVGGPS